MTLYLRQTKGIPLSNDEVDQNFTFLNNQVNLKVNSADYTAADVLTKLKTVDGTGSGLDADLLDGLNTSSTLPVSVNKSSIVSRNTDGDFSAGTITAFQFNGPLTGDVTGNLTGNISGTASGLSDTLLISSGGTGATTAAQARANLGLGTISTQASNNVSITGGSISGITDLAIVDGGTGASTAIQARANLGLTIGTDVQPYDADLTAIAANTSNGIYVRNGAGSLAVRSIAAGTGVAITNADGVSGNPTISIGQAVNTNSSVTFNSVNCSSTVHAGAYLYSYGPIYAQGNIIAYYSDDRLKNRLGNIDNALEKVKTLDGFYYEPNATAQALGYELHREVGVSAQQVQAILPEIIHDAPVDNQYMTVDYERLVPLLIEAIKELSDKVDALSKDVK